MVRLKQILCRYGWRTPWIVGCLANDRFLNLRSRVANVLLWLETKGSKGKGAKIGRHLRVNPGANLCLGKGVYIGDRCTFEIGIQPEAKVQIADGVWISHDCHLQSLKQITIGRDVLIGELVSIRDTSHTYRNSELAIKGQPDVSGSITIEEGAWIGRGVLILGKPPGIVIGRGAIIGANAVVTCSIPAMEIWGGVPAKFIKKRLKGAYPPPRRLGSFERLND